MRTQADLEDELAAYKSLERAEIAESNVALVMSRWPRLSPQAASLALLVYGGGRRGVSRDFLMVNLPGRSLYGEDRDEKIVDVVLHRLRQSFGRTSVKILNNRLIMHDDWLARIKRLTS